jgi:hypothetical protein
VEVFLLIIDIVAIVILIVCMWIIFTRAGRPGWACIVPIYNVIVLCDMVGRSRWWTLLYFIPLVNIVAYIVLFFGLAKAFGRSDAFGVGLVLLPIIFLPILAFTGAGETASASGTVRPQQGATLAWDSAKQPPAQAKCPFCHSPTFRVEQEAGSRRCSECHSVLPSYIQGSK